MTLISVSSLTSTGARYKIRGVLPMPSLPDDGVELASSLNDHCVTTNRRDSEQYSPPASRQRKRIAPPFVRRQMSMAELDMPRGPDALSSTKAPTSQ